MSPTIANDKNCIYYSTATYVDDVVTINQTDITAGKIGVAQLTSMPYSATELTQSAQDTDVCGRLVAASLHAWYAGTELNLSGNMFTLIEPAHGNLNGVGVSDLSAYASHKMIPITSGRPRARLTVGPIKFTETQYLSFPTPALGLCYPYASGQYVDASLTSSGGVCACILFTGVPGSRFSWKYYQPSEYVGQRCGASATPNDFDPDGARLMQATNIQSQSSQSNMAQKTSFNNELAKNARTATVLVHQQPRVKTAKKLAVARAQRGRPRQTRRNK